MKTNQMCLALAVAGLFIAGWGHTQEKRFLDLVGPGPVGPMPAATVLQVPYITWGGDMATFYANQGLTTKAGSIFQRQGLNLKLVAGDDFIQQVRDYRAGKSPFLRGTFHMIGLASEVIGADPRTKGVVILQLTWSQGDHMVARGNIKTLADLKGKTVALQQGGPHVGMLDDVLRTAKLTWDDIKVVWAKDLTGSADSPPELFRKRNDIDACFAITPDMVGLCSGLDKVGSGAEGTVKGARVLVSTAQMSHSIADVYVCRKDFYDANKELVAKFVAGYLKAGEEIAELKKAYEQKKETPAYKNLLQLTQDIYGKTTIPVLDDAHGLLSDCLLAHYGGNYTFFKEQGTGRGFDDLHKSALDLAISRGYAKERFGLFPSDLDYKSPTFVSYLTYTKLERGSVFKGEALAKEIEALNAGGGMDDRTILFFTIHFEPNQDTFTSEQYGAEFSRVTESAAKFGHAAIAIRGHADPTKTLLDLVKSGMRKGVLRQVGTPGNFSYSLNGQPLDLTATATVMKTIEAGAFDGVPDINPRDTMQSALNLSKKRAEAVRDSIFAYARNKGLLLDTNQITSVGVGIREPVIAKPASLEEARKNMRVEFRIIRVSGEVIDESEFNKF